MVKLLRRADVRATAITIDVYTAASAATWHLLSLASQEDAERAIAILGVGEVLPARLD